MHQLSLIVPRYWEVERHQLLGPRVTQAGDSAQYNSDLGQLGPVGLGVSAAQPGGGASGSDLRKCDVELETEARATPNPG